MSMSERPSHSIRITGQMLEEGRNLAVDAIAAMAPRPDLFRARHLTREQVERGYEQMLSAIDAKRLEMWALFVMEKEPGGKKKAAKQYQQLGEEYDTLAADFAAWQAANPEE